ncbi:RadC family protein [Pontibacter sp. G13]|uniref:RadC family protein n=1 Tax=Pontibacter sp. G13 TaxID=3074898 RepID=UPI00288A6A96|nr:DNA repair protein RadC [Pontibacter sp. G13]WNJ21082.1 DNA repair protein RadC [Pontibacter sp. G13]
MDLLSYKPIHTWAVEDRPREKLAEKGLDALTDAELLAIILGSGTRNQSALDLARSLLDSHQNLQGLAAASSKALTKIRGIGPVKAQIILVVFELGRRKSQHEAKRRHIRHSRDAAKYLQEKLADRKQEVFWAIFLNQNHEIVHEQQFFEGGIASTVIDTRVIMHVALEHLAAAMIICHNHPSGNLRPSAADRAITRKIKSGADIFDIRLLDHIIVSHRGYYSFTDEGLLD